MRTIRPMCLRLLPNLDMKILLKEVKVPKKRQEAPEPPVKKAGPEGKKRVKLQVPAASKQNNTVETLRGAWIRQNKGLKLLG